MVISSQLTYSIWKPWPYSIRKYFYHHIYLFRISADGFSRKQIPNKTIWEILMKVERCGKQGMMRHPWQWDDERMTHPWQAPAGSCYHPQAWGLWGGSSVTGTQESCSIEEGPGSHAVTQPLPENATQSGKELQRCILTSSSSCPPDSCGALHWLNPSESQEAGKPRWHDPQGSASWPKAEQRRMELVGGEKWRITTQNK